MTDQELRTLAYSKSPKTTKRTTFQDELQAAVSSRASKTKTEQYSNYDDEDEFFNKILNSRKKRIDAFKAGKSKAKLNTFDLSDDENKPGISKRVSFLKSQRNDSNSKDKSASDLHENEPLESSVGGNDNNNDSFSSKHSTNEENIQLNNINADATDPQTTRETSSLLYQTSDDTLPLPLPSDGSVEEAPDPGEEEGHAAVEETSQTSQLSASSLKNNMSADSVAEREPPKPKPRQRILGLKSPASEKPVEETESQHLNRPQTSSMSVPLSTDTSSNITWTDHTGSPSLDKSSNKSERSQLFTKSTFDSGSRDGFISDDSKEGCSKDPSTQLSRDPENSFDTGINSCHFKTSERSESVCSKKVESKYLGTLKILDRKVSLEESQPQTAESLRAAVYQEWLKKKRETSRQSIQLKKKEGLLKEKAKKAQEAKKEDAVASYDAWKEKKAENLKAKSREMNKRMRKEQQAAEEKEEKRQSAQQLFEKWKQEQDHLHREKYRKQKETENKLRLQKREREEERKKDSKMAFSDWCEKKKNVIHEKLKKEREEIQTRAEVEQYMKEERENTALEMYENWLTRKCLEQKRTREERRIQAIIRDSPPPPWSPPNRIIPFKK